MSLGRTICSPFILRLLPARSGSESAQLKVLQEGRQGAFPFLQLDRLHLIDDAVRGGGLGPLLKQCLENLLVGR